MHLIFAFLVWWAALENSAKAKTKMARRINTLIEREEPLIDLSASHVFLETENL